MERRDVVKAHGNPATLTGSQLRVGDKAPDFTVLDRNLKEIGLKNFEGKFKLISVTPSLDTPVCDMQARRFNQEAAKFPDSVVVMNISMDLPFAISRFCTTAGIDKVKAFSDHRDSSFGMAYGVLVKELRLLARSVFILDRDNTIRYIEIVPELTEHPDYVKALNEMNKLLL